MGKVRVLLDTNVVLDFFTGRMHDGVAAKIVQIGRTPQYEMCISFLTAINTLYIAKRVGLDVSPQDITSYFTILPQDSKQWADAATFEMSDFEDAIQASCALNNDCYIAVSRDHHFDSAPMGATTPERFLQMVLE